MEGHAEKYHTSLENMKEIFIVENDSDIRGLIEFLLVNNNYRVESFSTAEAFFKRIISHLPDLILLEKMLPDGDGVEICVKLKSQESTSSIPVVLMAAHTYLGIQADSGADDFISKPFDIDDFTDRVSRQLK